MRSTDADVLPSVRENLSVLTSRGVPARAKVQAHRVSSGLSLHEQVPRATDHHSSGCLSAEKFPTFACRLQDREQQLFQVSVVGFTEARRAKLLRKNSRHTGMDLRDELIRLACDNRASAQPLSGFGIFPVSASAEACSAEKEETRKQTA